MFDLPYSRTPSPNIPGYRIRTNLTVAKDIDYTPLFRLLQGGTGLLETFAGAGLSFGSALTLNPVGLGVGLLSFRNGVDNLGAAIFGTTTNSFDYFKNLTGNDYAAAGLDIALNLGTGAAAAKQIQGLSSTTVFRVEGAGNARILIDNVGNVSITGKNTLFLNFGQESRAQQFLQQRLADPRFSDSVMKSFKVDKSFLNQLRNEAVTEDLVKTFPGRPIRVDTTKAPDQFGLRSQQFDSFGKAIIPGSGKIRK